MEIASADYLTNAHPAHDLKCEHQPRTSPDRSSQLLVNQLAENNTYHPPRRRRARMSLLPVQLLQRLEERLDAWRIRQVRFPSLAHDRTGRTKNRVERKRPLAICHQPRQEAHERCLRVAWQHLDTCRLTHS
eukprot:4267356-Prymnesium_polylepis.3